jgi:hypothetical protein
MPRSTNRLFAFVVLALLGAPLAMHVVLHDLQEHHHGEAQAHVGENGHGDHEHPVVSSPAPQVPSLTRVVLPIAVQCAMTLATWSIPTADRNVVSFGALRMDDDVGLQAVLSTFLI